MGIFSKTRIISGSKLYKEDIKPKLKAHDGKIHLIMLTSFSNFINQFFGVETKYTEQVGTIVDLMQEDGYEIVDIKFQMLKGQGIGGHAEGFSTLILYK